MIWRLSFSGNTGASNQKPKPPPPPRWGNKLGVATTPHASRDYSSVIDTSACIRNGQSILPLPGERAGVRGNCRNLGALQTLRVQEKSPHRLLPNRHHPFH